MTTIAAFIRKYFSWFWTALMFVIANINWKNPRPLTDANKKQLLELLQNNYYIILTRCRSHLATYTINFSDYLLTGKWGYYDHCLMNFATCSPDGSKFTLIQATEPAGTETATFDEVFGQADSVCLITPVNMSLADWTALLNRAKSDLGKPYDTLFDTAQDKQLSCIELVRNCLQADSDYATKFAAFEADIAKYGELTPQMLYNNPDFKTVLEIRVP